jgi:hypothetical protein
MAAGTRGLGVALWLVFFGSARIRDLSGWVGALNGA